MKIAVRRQRLTLFSWLLLSWTVCGSACAQAPDSQTATLHVESREVVLDVVVVDKSGNFVNGLTKEDFTVLEDKVKQRIVSFQTPSMHEMAPGIPAVVSTADLQKIGNAPVTILVLDELNTQFADMAYAREALQKWLERQPDRLLQPTALMAASDEKFAVIRDFTQSREDLLKALKQHFPSYPYRMSKGGSIGPDAGERMAMSLGTLMQIAQASSGTSGRKNVVWVGVGFPELMLDDVSGTKEAEITKAAVHATDAMLKARVTLSIIDPTAMADSSLDLNNPDYLSLNVLQQTLGPTSASASGYLNFDTFAPATGGAFYSGRNDVDQEIAQAVANGSNYYTLSYPPSNRTDDPAKFRNISIVMKDPNLTATTRTGYFPEVQLATGIAPAPPTTHDLAFDLISAGLSSVIYDGLHVDAQKEGEGYVLHVLSSDLKPHSLNEGSDVAEITVMQVCFGPKNKVLSHQAFELTSRMPRSGKVDFALEKLNIPKGTVRMRLVARDAISGHIGTVDMDTPQ